MLLRHANLIQQSLDDLSLAEAPPVDFTVVQRLLDFSTVWAAYDLEPLFALPDREHPWTDLVEDLSGSTRPLTGAASPWPNTDSMIIRSRALVVGSAVNITPETSEKIIFWMITAIAGSSAQMLLGPIGQHPLAIQRRPAIIDPRQHVGEPDDIGETRIHPGERAVAGILGGT